MRRDESGKVREIEKCQDIPTYLDFTRLFHLLISATILQNPDYTNDPDTQKVGINQDISTFPEFQDLSRLVSISLGYNPNFLDPTRYFSMPSRSRFLPDGQDKSAPQSTLNSSRFLSGSYPPRDISTIVGWYWPPAAPAIGQFLKYFPPSFQNCYDCSSAVGKAQWKQSA